MTSQGTAALFVRRRPLKPTVRIAGLSRTVVSRVSQSQNGREAAWVRELVLERFGRYWATAVPALFTLSARVMRLKACKGGNLGLMNEPPSCHVAGRSA
jgi:hypothetical protein